MSQVDGFPGKFVAAVWQGLILVQNSGAYLFSTFCTSGCKLWVDGDVVVDNSGTDATASSFPRLTTLPMPSVANRN